MKNSTKILAVFALLALAILGIAASHDETGTIRYRGGALISVDTSFIIKDEDGNWTLNNSKLGVLAAQTLTKSAFSNSYAATTSDGILFCNGTNQVITLPNAATVRAGRTFTIVSATTTGSAIVTNYNGVQTVLGGLSVPVSATNRLTVISDGVNYW